MELSWRARCATRPTTTGGGRLEASYVLNWVLAQPVLDAANSFEDYEAELQFVGEVVHAMSGLGLLAIADATGSDATYGNALIDVGDLIEIDPGGENLTARVALRFGDVLEPEIDVTASEMVHLYVHHLYKRLSAVA